MSKVTQVAIIGAGPYGLSIAAHLCARNVRFRIFGHPMESWCAHMPAGMFLKSEGFASDLYDPEHRFTLKHFCASHDFPYADSGLPIPLDVMAAYGRCFQQRLVPEVERQSVVAVDRAGKEFLLQLADNETLTARRVIVAVGTMVFRHMPSCLADLSAKYASHSCDHHDLSPFEGRNVTVVGAGASALDLAALLQDAGAQVRIVARRPSLVFLSRPARRSLWRRLRYPTSGIGGGWRSRFFTDAPMLFRYLPEQLRLRTVKTYLGPAGAWFIKERLDGRVPILLAHAPTKASVRNGQVRLQLKGETADCELTTDHVIAATGYRVDIHKLMFLGRKIVSTLRTIEHAPLLSQNFESSISGLYFVGLASGYCFGPVMRFLYGAGYTARRLSEHLN